MDIIKRINNVDQGFKKLRELEVGKEYKILLWKFIPTIYGSKISITICDEDDINYVVFLPHKFNKLSDEEVESLNKQKLKFVYNGLNEVSGPFPSHNVSIL